LLERLKQQDEVIKKSKRKVDENMEHIQKMQNEIVEIKTQARLFSTKDCVQCAGKLELPTIHFMCGHSFHDTCVDSEGVRKCPKCSPGKDIYYVLLFIEFKEVIDKRDQLIEQAGQTEPFINELKESQSKFDVIAGYFGRGLFAELNKHIQNK
jgi:hypothetical protein